MWQDKIRYRRFSLIILCIILYGIPTVAFSAGNGDYLRHIGDGVTNSIAEPALLAWYCGGIAGASLLDGQIKERFNGRLLPKSISRGADWYGKGVNWALGNSYIIGEYLAGDRAKSEALDNLQVFNEAWAANLAATYLLKTVVRRERPGKQNNFSFPSGHSSGSFCVAAMLQELYGNRAGVPAFTLAAITGVQRIHANKHWFSDVLAGALLGACIGHGFAELVTGDKSKQKNKSFRVNLAWSL